MNDTVTEEKGNQQIKPLRVFLAITFSQDIIHKLTQVMKQLETSLQNPAIRWEKPENLHVTLRFIGSMHPNDLESLSEKIQTQLTSIDPFKMIIGEAHLFPSPKKTRVIAMTAEPFDKLSPLADALDRAVVATGFAKADHPFRGHLTIARIKAKRHIKIELPEVAGHGQHNQLIETSVEHVDLIASTTTAKGSVYHLLKQFKI